MNELEICISLMLVYLCGWFTSWLYYSRDSNNSSKAQENQQLKDYIICEVDSMAAYAPFDDLGNDKMFVLRAFLNVGDIIPELKELKEEVEITCFPN